MDHKKIARVEGWKWLGLGLLFVIGAASAFWMFRVMFSDLPIPGSLTQILINLPAMIIGLPGAIFIIYGLWLLTLDVPGWDEKQARKDAHGN